MHQSMSQSFGHPHIATTSQLTECPQKPLFQALSTSPQYVHVHNIGKIIFGLTDIEIKIPEQELSQTSHN